MDFIQEFLSDQEFPPQIFLLAGIALSIFFVVVGLSGMAASDDTAARRMRIGSVSNGHGQDFDLIQGDNSDPHGLLRAFVPSSKRERSKIGKLLRQAGIQRKHAIRSYYTFRLLMGFVLPAVFVAAVALPIEVQVQIGIASIIQGITWLNTLQIVTALMVAGFYGPAIWLRYRIRKRRQAIEHSLPNALDLLQVAIEAGLGFDAAMIRVSHEMANAAPEISQEFSILQLELQAGKERQAAFLDMADRVGIDELNSFANAFLQSNQYGTSISASLRRFATDMRLDRELRAQEKANRLPVQMSAVMAMCMMPVLLLICLAPMLIRWVNMFG
ncbi:MULTISPECIES: type II secretion system F family protein [unclassified Ruegeria]|uniref:type II secretion system F family protein n=1 Tax=unclassified Ruegeria TaxID=2625375 RepID=UPI001490A8F0|nr:MULTISPECIES: type II secretion system F family protein [unclassified Ruegeria]NOD88211.1 type II secretion system F family protein [Ruegeria sp. HKCCD4318]NOE13120.1 type II secretion system F family protein [Ruegeria sp. HKCCD4318-2]NOG11338.1 type II secretion system F family protein [Ruegeria sp. HKCCD4315]